VDIKEFTPWVKIIAKKIHRNQPANILLEDLIQDGMIGLIMAFREHDADSGISFPTFAGNKIKWAIMDGLRAGDWAEKTVRSRANKVSKTIEQLQVSLFREPLKREIADALGVRVEDITTILGEVYGYNFVRIEQRENDESQENKWGNEIHDIPDSSMEPSAIVERREAYSRAVANLKDLLPDERKAFILRMMCDMSGKQAATEMGVSVSRVCQLYKSATEKLSQLG
jgi:RNA polymerase sigma factor for flagellar operon FliA